MSKAQGDDKDKKDEESDNEDKEDEGEGEEEEQEEDEESEEEEVKVPTKKFDKLRIAGDALAESESLEAAADDVSSTIADDDDESLAPIEKIDNRAKPAKVVEQASEEKEGDDVAPELVEAPAKPEIKIDTQTIVKNVKMKLAKNQLHSNINTRKRNIIKSKAKKEIRDTVKSYSG